MRHITRSNTPWILAGLILAGLLAGYLVFPHRSQPTAPVTYSAPPQPTLTFAPTPTSRPTPKPTPKIQYIQAFVTYYGWPDNGPSPGNGIAFPKSGYAQSLHEVAGGTGTYADPVSFASSANLFKAGTKLYVPYLKKYVIKEDLCGSCGSSPRSHIDIWMESVGTHPAELNQCQGDYTKVSTAVEVNPPPGRPVNSTPLFNKATGECLK